MMSANSRSKSGKARLLLATEKNMKTAKKQTAAPPAVLSTKEELPRVEKGLAAIGTVATQYEEGRVIYLYNHIFL